MKTDCMADGHDNMDGSVQIDFEVHAKTPQVDKLDSYDINSLLTSFKNNGKICFLI